MQLTEKLRAEITLSLPKIGTDEVERIVKLTGKSKDTVYREWRKIIGRQKGPTDMEHPVVIALCELAVNRLPLVKANQKKISRFTKQLSAA